MRSPGLAILLVFAASAAAWAAQQSSEVSQAVADCQRYDDVRFEDIDAQDAISACLSAVRIKPDDPRLQAHLGRGYLKAKQDQKALFHLQRGADRNDSRALITLGFLYKVGRGVPQDDGEAVRLFRTAADSGDTSGMNQLGLMYKLGRGVPQDDDEAVRLFRKAEGKGDIKAAISLGGMYQSGRGVPKNDGEAARLYRKAADAGSSFAMGFLAAMYMDGHGVQQDDGEMVGWLRKAAAKGNGPAIGILGALYFDGRGVQQDDGEAVRLFRQSAEKGYPRSMYFLGGMYEAGRGVGKDSKIAASHVFRSLKTWDKYAARQLAANPDGWSKAFYTELQRLLKKEGVYSGPLDGRFGLALQSSIKALQRR